MTVQEAYAKGQNAIEAAKRTAQLTLAQAKNEAFWLFLKNDTSNNAGNDMPTNNKPAIIALKARCEVAELQAKQWRAKYEQAMRKLYGKEAS